MIYGADYLFGKFYKTQMNRSHPRGWAAGIFFRSPEDAKRKWDAKKIIVSMCKTGKYSEIVIHLAPFDKTHNYPITEETKHRILKDTQWVRDLQLKYPDTKLLPSPFCEHNHLKNEITPLLMDMLEIMVVPQVVNSIWRGSEVPGTITEIHLANSKLPKRPKNPEYTVSFDGFGGKGEGNFTDTNIENILNNYSDARHIRWWDFNNNGKFGWEDTSSVDNRRFFPSTGYLKARHAMMKKREGSITYPNKALYKPCSDAHEKPTWKDGMPLVITHTYENSIQAKDIHGKKIISLTRVLPDYDVPGPLKGAARYYSREFSNKLGDLAEKSSGSRLVQFDNLPLTDVDLRSSKFK